MTPTPSIPESSPSAALPVCLLVHGSSVAGRSWRALAAPFASRALTPDRLGCGTDDDWPAGRPTSLDLEAEHLAPLLLAQPAPVHLFGHSMGGAVALQLARRWPERVASLTLHEPTRFALLFADAASAAEADEIGRVGRTVSRLTLAGRCHDAAALFVDYWSGAGTWGTMDESRRERLAATMTKVGAEFDAAFADPMPLEAWRGLTMPVRLLASQGSPAPVRRIIALLRTVLPHADGASLPGVGHMAPLTHPDLVRPWLSGAAAETARQAAVPVPMPMPA